MTRFVCMSDTHLQHRTYNVKVPDGDILIHSGDATWRGNPPEMEEFWTWFLSFPHPHKVFVAGNHEVGLENYHRDYILKNWPKEIIYLQDSATEILGFKFWGTPVQPFFCNWAFNYQYEGDRERFYNLIPEDTDILVTHSPPFGYRDSVIDPRKVGHRTGCHALLRAVKRVKPILHVFGHIHGGYGTTKTDDTIFVNAALCDENYAMINKPIVLDIER